MFDISIVKEIREGLQLMNDSDYKIVLGIAEKISPGIYKLFLGDPDMIEEKIY